MAIGYYHCEERQDHSAQQYEYNTRTGKFAGKGKEDLVCSGNNNLPSWAKDDPIKFWQANDKFEKGTKGKSIIIALPNEMNTEELTRLMEKTVDTLYPDHAVSWSIHDSIGPSGKQNKHAHVQVCERLIDHSRPEPSPEQYFKKTRTLKDGTISGGYKKDTTMTGKNRRKWLNQSKIQWVDLCNEEIRQMRDNLFRSRPKEIEIKKSKKRSVHYPRRVWMAAMRNINRKDNFLRTKMDRKIYPILKKRQNEIEKLKDEITPQATMGDIITSYVWHPLSKQKRERMVWAYRSSRITEPDKWRYEVGARDINIRYGPSIKKIQTDYAEKLEIYCDNLGIKSPVIESKYQPIINKVVHDSDEQAEIDRNVAKYREEEKRRKQEEQKQREAEERKRQQEEKERIERLHREQEKARQATIVIHRPQSRGISRTRSPNISRGRSR